MRISLTILLSSIFLYANTSTDIINNNIKDFEEKRVYEEQKRNQELKQNKIYNMDTINVNEDFVNEEDCIKIEKINILDMTVFKKSFFTDLIKPYINECNGLKNLSIIRDKISNEYINRGYVTSRAFIKLQDLSDGVVDINVIEGKIEKIIVENININNLFLNHSDKILNLRELEILIQQAERLKSQNLDLQLIPGNKIGYTIVKIINNSNEKNYGGNLGINNFGNQKTGKYQIYNNFNYENLFGYSDVISINANFTNNVLKNNDNTFGTSLSYSLPLERFLFDFIYNYSNYQQINTDEFNSIFESNGNNKSSGINITYKYYHSINHNIEMLLNYEDKTTKNILNDVVLSLQSYSITSLGLGIKHSFKENSYDYYTKLMFFKGLKGNKDIESRQEIDYEKYVFDLGFNKYFNSKNRLKYNFYLRGQLSNSNLFGTEEISMGGIYSVRGFKNTGLSGNSGFYFRNEFSSQHEVSNFIFSPYLGLDFGYVKKDENNISGSILGGSFGTRIYYKKFNVELFYNHPLKDAEATKEESSNFLGFNLVLNY